MKHPLEHAAEDAALDALFGALPCEDLSPERAAAIRSAAHRAIASERAFPARMRRVYRRIEPFCVGAIAASYLIWAVGVVLR